jgi:cytochrome c oxidase subunit 2
MRHLRAFAAISLAQCLAGCTAWQSALHPRGPQARDLFSLFWLFTAVSLLVWLLVCVALAIALRRERPISHTDPAARVARTERRAMIAVWTAGAATVVVLIGLTVASFLATRNLAEADEDAVAIHVIGHQWWWEVRYDDPQPQRIFTTANEIHIPVGRPVRVRLTAQDVIHSFWVPSLAGKQDLIPGRENAIVMSAARPGIYRGQCAEFCGVQHAHMAMLLVADAPDAFDAWRAGQLRAAATREEERRGHDLFVERSCAACHTIRGTNAGGRTAPDLTHLASRRTIAAGQLPMTRETIAAFIADPQRIKPGSHMPRVDLAPAEIDALAGYLAALR